MAFDMTDIAGNSQGYTPRPPEARPLQPVTPVKVDPDVKPEVGTQNERNESTGAPEGLWSFDAAIDERNGDTIMITAPEGGEE